MSSCGCGRYNCNGCNNVIINRRSPVIVQQPPVIITPVPPIPVPQPTRNVILAPSPPVVTGFFETHSIILWIVIIIAIIIIIAIVLWIFSRSRDPVIPTVIPAAIPAAIPTVIPAVPIIPSTGTIYQGPGAIRQVTTNGQLITTMTITSPITGPIL